MRDVTLQDIKWPGLAVAVSVVEVLSSPLVRSNRTLHNYLLLYNLIFKFYSDSIGNLSKSSARTVSVLSVSRCNAGILDDTNLAKASVRSLCNSLLGLDVWSLEQMLQTI